MSIFLQGLKDLRSSNECSEEFIHRHDSNSFMDTLIRYKLMSSILYSIQNKIVY